MKFLTNPEHVIKINTYSYDAKRFPYPLIRKCRRGYLFNLYFQKTYLFSCLPSPQLNALFILHKGVSSTTEKLWNKSTIFLASTVSWIYFFSNPYKSPLKNTPYRPNLSLAVKRNFKIKYRLWSWINQLLD